MLVVPAFMAPISRKFGRGPEASRSERPQERPGRRRCWCHHFRSSNLALQISCGELGHRSLGEKGDDDAHRSRATGQVQIICTLGPSSYEPEVIRRLTDRRVDLLRINLSHTDVDEIEARINHVRTYTDVPVCLDTEGAQVRCGPVERGPGGQGRFHHRAGGRGGHRHRRAHHAAAPRGLRRAAARARGSRSTSTAWCCGSPRSGDGWARADGGAGRRARVEQGCGGRSRGAAPAAVREGPRGPLDRPTARHQPLRPLVRLLGRGRPPDPGADPGPRPHHRQDREHGRRAAHGRDHRGQRRRPDRPGRPLPRGAGRADPLLPEGDRAAGQPLAHPAVRGHQPARVDGHLQPTDHRRDERHRQHAARRRPRPRPGGRDGHRCRPGRCGRHGQAGHRGLRAGGLRSAHRRHSPRRPRGRRRRASSED